MAAAVHEDDDGGGVAGEDLIEALLPAEVFLGELAAGDVLDHDEHLVGAPGEGAEE